MRIRKRELLKNNTKLITGDFKNINDISWSQQRKRRQEKYKREREREKEEKADKKNMKINVNSQNTSK